MKRKALKWTSDVLAKEGEKLYGKDKISYRHVKKDEDISANARFLLECLICSLIWPTTTNEFINNNKGCPWCRNECRTMRTCTLDMVIFVATKIHKGKYLYRNNKSEDIKTINDTINGWCRVEGHEDFTERIGDHLSRKKNPGDKKGCQGCPECKKIEIKLKKETRSKTKRKKWKNNLELLKSEGKRVHGDLYNYDDIDPETIVTSQSVVDIKCNRITKEGNICSNVFPQQISNHINAKAGCPVCAGSFKYNKEIFIQAAEKKYPGMFLYHRIQDDEIVDQLSKPTLECAFCGYIINTSTINDFMCNNRKCERCNKHENWTAERLQYECELREKEGEYTYENVDFSKIGGCNTIIPISCLKCKKAGFEYIFKQSLVNHFVAKHGCQRCGGSLPWSYERFQTDIPQILLDNYSYDKVTSDMFENKSSIIPIDCKRCKNEFKRTVYQHLMELKGCTYCTKSDGSKMVYMLLKEFNIEFEDEVICMGPNGNYCRFDYKFLYKGVWFIIEYDGNQHFNKMFWHADEEQFNYSRLNDIHKQYIALKDNCKIIRIDYKISYKNIREHLLKALELNAPVYYSTPDMYVWLDEGVKNYILPDGFEDF